MTVGTSYGQLDETIPSTGGFLVWEQEYDYSRETILLEAGQTVAAGQVVGVVTGTGEVKARDAAAGDGSEVPRGVMIDYVNCVDAANAPQDKTGTFAREGHFNPTALVLGAGHTVDSIKVGLADKGIHMQALKYSG